MTPQVAAQQFMQAEAAAVQEPATPMVSVASHINVAADIVTTIAVATPERREFEEGFRRSMAGFLGDGTTVRQETVFVDDISEASAIEAAMFAGLAPSPPLAPLPPAVRVDFHVAVPDGLQTTTVSLVETLNVSGDRLEIVFAGVPLPANAASLVSPIWISMGTQCDFAATLEPEPEPEPEPNDYCPADCGEHGTCIARTCHCDESWSGPACSVNPCDESPCQNGGICSAGTHGFSCVCQPQYVQARSHQISGVIIFHPVFSTVPDTTGIPARLATLLCIRGPIWELWTSAAKVARQLVTISTIAMGVGGTMPGMDAAAQTTGKATKMTTRLDKALVPVVLMRAVASIAPVLAAKHPKKRPKKQGK